MGFLSSQFVRFEMDTFLYLKRHLLSEGIHANVYLNLYWKKEILFLLVKEE